LSDCVPARGSGEAVLCDSPAIPDGNATTSRCEWEISGPTPGLAALTVERGDGPGGTPFPRARQEYQVGALPRKTLQAKQRFTMPDPALAKKLNVKPGMKLQVVGKPEDVDLGDLPTATSGDAAGVLLFVRKLVDVDAMGAEFLAAAREDRLAWIAYPKAGKLGTDL